MSDATDNPWRGGDLPSGVEGTAEPEFGAVVRAFARAYVPQRGSGGALAVFLHGEPVVDIWAGSADAAGQVPWQRNTGSMIYSASKGVTATVMHRLADRQLIDYDAPVARYWPEFGANGKSRITVRQVLSHRAGLSSLAAVARSGEEMLDHHLMEERLAAVAPDGLIGRPAYHGLTLGWLLSGLARAVTGLGMKELYRQEIAEPLGIDGIHLGRTPVGAATGTAAITGSKLAFVGHPLINPVVIRGERIFGTRTLARALYVPGIETIFEGEQPILDSEMPAGNAVATAPALAKLYSALACNGIADGKQYLSPRTIKALSKVQTFQPDRVLYSPMLWHLGYHAFPAGALRGFGHEGMGGSGGWADPKSGLSIALVHNRLSTARFPLDMTRLAALSLRIQLSARRSERWGNRDLGAAA